MIHLSCTRTRTKTIFQEKEPNNCRVVPDLAISIPAAATVRFVENLFSDHRTIHLIDNTPKGVNNTDSCYKVAVQFGASFDDTVGQFLTKFVEWQ